MTEAPLMSTHPIAPRPADMPLMGVPAVEVASSDAAGCCSLALRTSVSDIQREDMSIMVPSSSAAASEEAYVSVKFWRLQQPTRPQQNALQATQGAVISDSADTQLLHTSSSSLIIVHLASLDAPATELLWSFIASDSTMVTEAFFLPGLRTAVQPMIHLLPLLGDGTTGPQDTVFMIVSTNHLCLDEENDTSLQRTVSCTHSLPNVWHMDSALDIPTLDVLEHSALMPSGA